MSTNLVVPSSTPTTETVVGTLGYVRAVSGPKVPTVTLTDEATIQHLPPSFEYGQETGGAWETVPTDGKAQVGDTLRITYKMGLPFLEDWQTKFIVARLNADSRYELRHVTMNEELRRLVVEVRILKPFSPAFLVPIAIIAVLAGAMIWLTTLLVEKLIVLFGTDPKQASGVPWLSIALVGTVAVAGLVALSRIRGPA